MKRGSVTYGPGVGSRWRASRRWRRVLVAGVLLVGLAFAPWLWVLAESRGGVHRIEDAPSAPVALVLGAGLKPDGTPTPFLVGRLEVARALYAAGRVQVILVSGDNRVTTYDEPTAMRDWLVANGVPEADVVRDFAGRDTYDSCSRALRIFGVTDLIVVSQGYHLPRAVATCRALGVETQGVGDWTAEQYASTWANGALREKAAAVKTVWDLVSGRDPVLGAVETSVTDALARQTG